MLLRSVLIAMLVASAATVPGDARGREGDRPMAERSGRTALVPLPIIEDRVVPRMRGATYLGPELHGGSVVYRLKFIRDGKVIWVDVDARTGRVLSITE